MDPTERFRGSSLGHDEGYPLDSGDPLPEQAVLLHREAVSRREWEYEVVAVEGAHDRWVSSEVRPRSYPKTERVAAPESASTRRSL